MLSLGMAHLPEDNDGVPTTRALSAELPLRDGEGSDAPATQEIAELERLLQEARAKLEVIQHVAGQVWGN